MPTEVGEMKVLNIISLNSNKLIGEFPAELFKLQCLKHFK